MEIRRFQWIADVNERVRTMDSEDDPAKAIDRAQAEAEKLRADSITGWRVGVIDTSHPHIAQDARGTWILSWELLYFVQG